jgi:hypothetical protein
MISYMKPLDVLVVSGGWANDICGAPYFSDAGTVVAQHVHSVVDSDNSDVESAH